MYVYMHVCVYTHTHTHTHTQVDAQEKLLARDSEAGSNQHMDGGKKTHKMHRPALHADSAQVCQYICRSLLCVQ